ncbi:MAG: DUF4494 domain-containing protein [Prevotella sp.]|nr:DUF4494 domain-containing protein [Prevotella sp.]MDY4851986.1 DUF4494 domain-containing protein [Prevotella sp.]
MRSRTAIWFECKVRYEKMMEDGMPKKVVELYTVDALSFSEAEERIMEEMSSYVSGEIEIADLKIAPYKEIFFADSDLADKWYKTKLAFITIDEKTDKEKKTSVFYLVNAGNINSAIKNIDEVMGGTMIDYQTINVSETSIMDVFEYKKKEKEDKPEYEQQ